MSICEKLLQEEIYLFEEYAKKNKVWIDKVKFIPLQEYKDWFNSLNDCHLFSLDDKEGSIGSILAQFLRGKGIEFDLVGYSCVYMGDEIVAVAGISEEENEIASKYMNSFLHSTTQKVINKGWVMYKFKNLFQ